VTRLVAACAVFVVACGPNAWEPTKSRLFGVSPYDTAKLATDTARELHYEVVLATVHYPHVSYKRGERSGYSASFVAVPTTRPQGRYAYGYAVALGASGRWHAATLEVVPLVYDGNRRIAYEQIPAELIRRGDDLRAAIVEHARLARIADPDAWMR